METSWGQIPVSDAHVHFFSHAFFATLAAERNIAGERLPELLGWHMPPENPEQLAAAWIAELDRHGVSRAALIASVTGDHASVIAAVQKWPQRLRGYMMVDPTAAGAAGAVESALASGAIHGLCFFPAMHSYSIGDPRAVALLDMAAARPGTIAFIHCGVLSVGVRRKLGLSSHFDIRYSNPIDIHPIAWRYPQLRVVIPHFGAGYLREALMLGDMSPNIYLDTSSSNSWMRFEAPLDLRAVFRRCLDVIGPSRLVFGTDSSFFPRGWNAAVFEAQARALYEIGADEPTARLIFNGNFEHLFS